MNANSSSVLITGASGGIGYELAKLFAKDRHNLVLVARSNAKLAQVAEELQRRFEISVKAVALDLTDPGAPQNLFDGLKRDAVSVDILVNNAGYGKLGEFAAIPLEEALGQIQLNIVALTSLTRLFLGPMVERRAGRILNVASTAGFQAGPLMAVYYATKAYVISFSEALANELVDKGVGVTCLCPGATATDFASRAGNDKSRLFNQLRPMDAKAVALTGYRGLIAGKTLVIAGVRNWLVAESLRISPRSLVTAVSRKLNESKGSGSV
jgi:short-subunit dehydrogenase